jgi:hypothetical protein
MYQRVIYSCILKMIKTPVLQLYMTLWYIKWLGYYLGNTGVFIIFNIQLYMTLWYIKWLGYYLGNTGVFIIFNIHYVSKSHIQLYIKNVFFDFSTQKGKKHKSGTVNKLIRNRTKATRILLPPLSLILRVHCKIHR